MQIAASWSIRSKLVLILGILALDLFVVMSLGVFGMWLLSGLRASVDGAGLWSKAQKNAIHSLTKYALSGDERDFKDIERFLVTPHGIKRARLALVRPDPDLAAASAGLIEAGLHPDDVRTLELIVLKLQPLPYFEHAIPLWTEADEVLDQQEALASKLHQEYEAGRVPKRVKDQAMRDIDAVNDRLTRLENAFTFNLGYASRWAQRLLLYCMLFGSALFGAAGLYAVYLIGGQIASGIQEVAGAAAKVAGGDLSVRTKVSTGDELGMLSQAFNDMTEGLAKLEQLKSDFISTVSHELRTPLTLTLAPLESMLAGELGEPPPEQRVMLEIMHNNAVRLLQLVSGLLDFSRLDAGKGQPHPEPSDAAALTRGIVEDFRPITRAKRQTLELALGPGSMLVQLDRYMYERILFNLLANAVKFTPHGGRIEVRLERTDGLLRAAVRDSGIGIEKEEQAKLFQKFRQVDSSSSRRFEGTGLGLALVKEFSQLLGGGVTLESEPGKGSVFRVEFPAPLAEGPLAESAPVISSTRSLARMFEPEFEPAGGRGAPQAAGKRRILVAEDNAELSLYLERLLRPLAELRFAREGEEALLAARTWNPDLVLTDVMMPKKDGLAVCRELKADPATAGLTVVLLTAMTDRESMTKGWEAGADEYLFKPFHPKEVVTRVQTLLASIEARRKAEAGLRVAKEAAEAANRELEAFSYSVAHDLRAPLRKIAGYGRILAGALESRLSPRELETLRKVESNVLEMDDLINGLLRLSSVTHKEPKKEVLNLSDVAAGISEELKKAQPERRVDFVIQPDIEAAGDREFLQIALRNLFENSWKFTLKRPLARIEFGAAEAGGSKVLFVRDNGVGFDMSHSSRLFGAFKRLHAAGDYPGTGIGLATVQRVIERHGGKIWAEAEPERGATFYFTLGGRAASDA